MKKAFCIVGMIIGISMVVLGLYVTFNIGVAYYGELPESYKFGADYYTEQYGVTRDVALNVRYYGDFIEEFLSHFINISGIFISLFGGTIVCIFGYKFADCKLNSTLVNPTNITRLEDISKDLPDI